MAELDLSTAKRRRAERRPDELRQADAGQIRLQKNMTGNYLMDLNERIPNNVNLSEDKRLQRALEKWLPNFLSWWHDMGPEGFQQKDVWLRTAVDVGSEGWAHFDYVKMPDYRWGIFLEPAEA